MGRWGADFDPDRLAASRPACGRRTTDASRRGCSASWSRVSASRASASWPRAVAASFFLTKAAVGFARSIGRLRAVRAGHRPRLPTHRVAARRRRGRRSPATSCAGGSSGARSAWRPALPRARRSPRLYAAIYAVAGAQVAEAGRLRGVAAEVRDRGARPIRDGPKGPGPAYWPEVAGCSAESYRSLHAARAEAGPSRSGGPLSARRPPADDPPGNRKGRGSQDELDRVADEERRQALGDAGREVGWCTTISHGTPTR